MKAKGYRFRYYAENGAMLLELTTRAMTEDDAISYATGRFNYCPSEVYRVSVIDTETNRLVRNILKSSLG